uniref:Uncharacterized protein n=2 Tax=Acrobeloides nanus TaxID=290746 RepID=A0A914EFE6_9BILA
MQLMQICFGISSSAEIAYLSYLYAIVRKKHYTKITSYTRAAKLIGKFLAYSMAQFLVSSGYGSYLLLHQITLGSMCLIVVIALFLPSINKGEDQVVSVANNNEDMEIQPLDMEKPKIENERLEKKDYVSGLKAGVKIYLANHVVLFWSIWWALSSCGAYQVYNYSQNLWALMQHNNQETFNGIVFIATTLIGALLTFSLPYIKVNWQHHGTVVFVISSVCLGVSLVLMGTIHNLFLAYALYIVVDMVYRLSNTIASNVIASELTSNSYSFIFGCDMFMALVLETGLTLIVADEHGLALDIRYQFIVYSGYFIVLAILFVILSILVRLRRANSKNLNEQQDIKS